MDTVEAIHQEPSDSHPTPQYVTKLPKLKVAKYGGDPLNWQSFWDCFESPIDLKSHLSGAETRVQVEDEAAVVIS